MSKVKETKVEKPSKVKNFIAEFKVGVAGVSQLAFVSAGGVAAYTLWFSTDSLTLHVIAALLAVRTAVDALYMSTKR